MKRATSPLIAPALATLWLTLAMTACLSDAEPQRVVLGSITDPDGRPIPDAAISAAGHVALTDAQGAFLLDGLPQDATGPLHVAADGFTAWTLDRRALDRLHARLQPNQPPITLQTNTLLSLTISLPQPLTEARTLYLAIDATLITPIRLLPGTSSHRLALPTPAGVHSLGLLAPPEYDGQPTLWAPTIRLDIPPSGAELTLSPQPTQNETITLQTSHPEPDAYSLAITCELPRAGRALVALGATWDGSTGRLAIAPTPPGVPCQLLATASPQDNATALVAFTAFPSDQPPQTLQLPPLALTQPAVDATARLLTWDAVPGADAYDLFLAHRDGDAIDPPFWSATTSSPSLALPALPPALTQRMAWEPQRALFVRVVARFSPRLDLEQNWDWSNYYGYIASPWVQAPPSLTDHWRATP